MASAWLLTPPPLANTETSKVLRCPTNTSGANKLVCQTSSGKILLHRFSVNRDRPLTRHNPHTCHGGLSSSHCSKKGLYVFRPRWLARPCCRLFWSALCPSGWFLFWSLGCHNYELKCLSNGCVASAKRCSRRNMGLRSRLLGNIPYTALRTTSVGLSSSIFCNVVAFKWPG